ncbi:uncharacterized protein L969DRAFT_87096, partial [Mixia osmundae IAM 14324]|uniref:uncharacterized protein n=1 Tax=Mixia osmundae (strain CBS 9802 / IAM 14324 / JCM 22182 / KY 12970) TaxID=764103 RepID=UPI0004A55027
MPVQTLCESCDDLELARGHSRKLVVFDEELLFYATSSERATANDPLELLKTLTNIGGRRLHSSRRECGQQEDNSRFRRS